MNNYICQNVNTCVRTQDKVKLGNNIVFGPNCSKIEIGYGTFLGDNMYIDVPELTIGEYCTLHKGVTIHGYLPCRIGHNCWIGQYTIIDSIGGVEIGNNVGVGASSQLWSHIKFGDTLEGCRWNKSKRLIIMDDVWIVGHCIVCPIVAHKKSMLLVGGVATEEMEENHVYAGVPAKDVTPAVGNQFSNVHPNNKRRVFNNLYKQFLEAYDLTESEFKATDLYDLHDVRSNEKETFFDLNNRIYIPSRSENEYKFMKFILYDKAKFIPFKQNDVR